jgi:hypothetical protein
MYTYPDVTRARARTYRDHNNSQVHVGYSSKYDLHNMYLPDLNSHVPSHISTHPHIIPRDDAPSVAEAVRLAPPRLLSPPIWVMWLHILLNHWLYSARKHHLKRKRQAAILLDSLQPHFCKASAIFPSVSKRQSKMGASSLFPIVAPGLSIHTDRIPARRAG